MVLYSIYKIINKVERIRVYRYNNHHNIDNEYDDNYNNDSV